MHIHKIYKIYMNYTEKIKWLCIAVILLLILVNYIFFIHKSTKLIKIIFFNIFFIPLFSLLFYTNIGKKIIIFIKDIKSELFQITWPNYIETLKTTGIVLLLIILTSVFLWIFDALILRIVSWILTPRL
ncbi:Protein translocase subunit SecE [Buchnera aphidicola (Cinara kochiana kochiana)]|uniref:Protein translocase subunit SecE n=1 Tax=Buchnera aphidicola (Cinara kochiana kochiana) TaxID=2518976 RepID=A0A451D569_9GAMM|nr:Protein translocase subunit SecE [Buchnera aphidicola (Cinara kochiana kochiana)]